MNNIEAVDIYDENKCKTGKIKIRHKDILEPGEYIVAVQAIILNSQNQILISQRAEFKEKCPLKWECNGGALLVGETIVEGVIREIYEELGIMLDKNKAIYLKTVKNNHRFKEIFLFKMDIDLKDIKFIDKEAIAAKWVDIQEFSEMFEKGNIVPSVDFDETDYKKCLELLKDDK